MKVTITLDGDVVVDTDDPTQALAMVAGLRNGTKPKPKQKRKKEKFVVDQEVQLSKELVDTWNWLVANDTPTGSKPEYAAGPLGCTVATAAQRMQKLVAEGLAYRVKRGYYRSGEAMTDPQEASQPLAE